MREYRMDSTLCRLAAITISKHLWKHSPLNRALKICMEDHDELEAMLPFNIMKIMRKFLVPRSAKKELTFVVGMMGREIWYFYCELQQTFQNFVTEDPMFASGPNAWVEYICWTNHGCIDFSETMRSLYVSNILPENMSTFILLCTYCVEDCLNDLFPKIEYIDPDSPWIQLLIFRDDLEFDLILWTYWTGIVTNDQAQLIDSVTQTLPEIFNAAHSLPENMFIYSFVSRKDHVLEYFWAVLDANQRSRAIATICQKVMSDDPTFQKFRDLFCSEDGLSVHSVFFLEQLSIYGHNEMKTQILGSGFVLRELLNWPYDNLFLKTLKESSTHDSIDYNPIILRLSAMVGYSECYQFIDRDFKYRRIFYELWEMNPKNLKTYIDYSEMLSTLWNSRQIELLNHILKDEELKGRRKEFLNTLVEIYDYDGSEDDFLDTFITRVLVSEEEREWFTAQIDLASQ